MASGTTLAVRSSLLLPVAWTPSNPVHSHSWHFSIYKGSIFIQLMHVGTKGRALWSWSKYDHMIIITIIFFFCCSPFPYVMPLSYLDSCESLSGTIPSLNFSLQWSTFTIIFIIVIVATTTLVIGIIIIIIVIIVIIVIIIVIVSTTSITIIIIIIIIIPTSKMFIIIERAQIVS